MSKLSEQLNSFKDRADEAQEGAQKLIKIVIGSVILLVVNSVCVFAIATTMLWPAICRIRLTA